MNIHSFNIHCHENKDNVLLSQFISNSQFVLVLYPISLTSALFHYSYNTIAKLQLRHSKNVSAMIVEKKNTAKICHNDPLSHPLQAVSIRSQSVVSWVSVPSIAPLIDYRRSLH